MDDVKQGYREVEGKTKEIGRKADGEEDLGDKVGNLGDDIRKNLGNAGDELRDKTDQGHNDHNQDRR